ncbi:antitoxin Xre/MbcA/ParS toxin-binding domain-containing protein [Pseudomonas sp. BMS12]|uniref:antitoxin Xre/MbcA/ParS toxin-binding domain-containing protein n=1 Tax=Pseudomonas sp. BMS12 TaxID=1796033 RepID=UPI0009EEF582|nr:antitoxin Xre/MbcA/ParS toxin-binding domain-containing protein [Pseudomonas sp. BMS12]
MMKSLIERLGLPQSHKGLHQATMAGLPVELTTRLAEELGIDSCVVAGWIGITPTVSLMTPAEGEAFCRLANLVDELMNIVESDQVAATRWLTSPNIALGNVQPVSLLSTEFGGRAVHQVLLSIEYGLPV